VKIAIAFTAGLAFALGLGLSGMTMPTRVLGFLDPFGHWDPSLLFVMVGAIAVHMPVSLWARRQGMLLPSVPCAGEATNADMEHAMSMRLFAGSAIFGVGWGLGGYCPGPGIVSAASGMTSALVFLAAMVLGTALYRLTNQGAAYFSPN
jgi:uncharacterized membrane protein YedE/YeeE